MPDQNGTTHGAHDSEMLDVLSRYVMPALATITALSFMAAASASIGVWRDVSVMRESMSTLIKNTEAQQKKYEAIKEQLQDHEVRLTKGNL